MGPSSVCSLFTTGCVQTRKPLVGCCKKKNKISHFLFASLCSAFTRVRLFRSLISIVPQGCVIAGSSGPVRIMVVAQASGLMFWNFDTQAMAGKQTLPSSEFNEKVVPFIRGITSSETHIFVGTSTGPYGGQTERSRAFISLGWLVWGSGFEEKFGWLRCCCVWGFENITWTRVCQTIDTTGPTLSSNFHLPLPLPLPLN